MQAANDKTNALAMWIVTVGEYRQGYAIDSIHTDQAAAQARAEHLAAERYICDVITVQHWTAQGAAFVRAGEVARYRGHDQGLTDTDEPSDDFGGSFPLSVEYDDEGSESLCLDAGDW